MISYNAHEAVGFCLFVACALAIVLIRDWALRDNETTRPFNIANRSTWRRPRRLLAERLAMHFGYLLLTAASADFTLRWLRAI